MSTHSNCKITKDHLRRRACLYVRQSSLHQVQHNKESQRRQYDLQNRAIAHGWSVDQIDVIDEDQGKSGATSAQRSGFLDLRARIGAGEVGLLLCLEISRLCRNSAEWSQLLQIAAITNTLILDEQAIYDAACPNDALLLGIKGQLSEYELRGIRNRMVGGQRSKARRGELKIPLPIGFAYTETDQVVKDPDRRIAEVLALVFRQFQKLGSARQVTKWLVKQKIPFPTRSRSTGIHSEVYWSTPTHGQIQRILRNPRHAGCYAYGRTKTKTLPDGRSQTISLPMDQWQVCIPEAHEGYISWDEYLQNQKTLRNNASSFLPETERIPSPRKGMALLQSRALCGKCGHRMRVHYGNIRDKAWYYVCTEQPARNKEHACQRIRGDGVDTAVSNFILASVNQENLALSYLVQEELRTNFEAGDRQRQNRIEHLQHQERLARRRFMAVDPSNRLVASTLEANWEQCIRAEKEAVQERKHYVQQHLSAPDAKLKEHILQLANDFGRVWNAEATTSEDRKRLLGKLIEDVTLIRNGYQVTVKLRLRGGRIHELTPINLPRPQSSAIRRDASPEVLAELETLLEAGYYDQAAAEALNQRGYRDSQGDPFTKKRIWRLRKRYHMKNGIRRQREKLQKQGYHSGRKLAAELDIGYETLRHRAQRGQGIQIHRIPAGKRTFVMYKLVNKS